MVRETSKLAEETCTLLEQLNSQEKFTTSDVLLWNVDEADECNVNDDADELSDDEEIEPLPDNRIPHTDAISALNTLLKWANENEMSFAEVSALQQIREKAINIMRNENTKTKQSNITDFFKKQ